MREPSYEEQGMEFRLQAECGDSDTFRLQAELQTIASPPRLSHYPTLQRHDEVIADDCAALDFVDNSAAHDHGVFDHGPRRHAHVVADDRIAEARAAFDVNALP